MSCAKSSHGTVLVTKEVHRKWDIADRSIGKSGLFEDNSRAIVLHKQVCDCTCFELNIDWPTYAQHLSSLLEMLEPPFGSLPRHVPA
jgi:hypothetical protein